MSTKLMRGVHEQHEVQVTDLAEILHMRSWCILWVKIQCIERIGRATYLIFHEKSEVRVLSTSDRGYGYTCRSKTNLNQ